MKGTCPNLTLQGPEAKVDRVGAFPIREPLALLGDAGGFLVGSTSQFTGE